MKKKATMKNPLHVKYDFDFNGKTYSNEALIVVKKVNGKKNILINLNLGKTKIPELLKEMLMMRIESKIRRKV